MKDIKIYILSVICAIALGITIYWYVTIKPIAFYSKKKESLD